MYFERATQLDSSHVLAWAALSRSHKWEAATGGISTEQGYRLAHEDVERALALNPNLAAASVEMGRIKQQSTSTGLERVLPSCRRLSRSREIPKL
jgi:hypothetical protein